MKILELKDISMDFIAKSQLLEGEKYYHVLRDINLDIHQGEIVVIVGESGCGKTTIGKIITGLLKPTKGEMLFLGRNIYKGSIFSKKKFDVSEFSDLHVKLNPREHKAYLKAKIKEKRTEISERISDFENSVQFVQQDSYASLNPARTIYQSLYAPIKNKNRKWNRLTIDNKINDLMALVGLLPAEQFLSKYPHQLSGGQRQRILLARAISLDPKLVVADEPVSMIDVSLRLSILDLMKRLNEKLNLSFVYITHDLSTARYIGYKGRICVMYLGEIMELGSVVDVISSPQHPYTQALLSSVPVPDPVVSRKPKPELIKSMDMGDLMVRTIGCPFYPRCPYAKRDCAEDRVPFVSRENALVRCKQLDEVPSWNEIS